MFETSRDILNWVLALSSAVLTFFLCWAVYYLISAGRRGLKLIRRAENSLSKVENLVDLVKNKIFSSASYVFMLGELVKKVSKFVRDRRQDDDEEEEEEAERKTSPRRKRKKTK